MDETNVQIIPYYAHPHVFTVIKDNSQYDETVAQPVDVQLPFSTAVVSGADQGIDNTFVRLTDLNTKIAIFGRGNFAKYGQSSIQADFLFNDSTNVWFCRVLPDNATYANMILLMNYRKGNELDELGQETGLKRLEVKFSIGYATKPFIVDGAVDNDTIIQAGNAYAVETADPQTGYMTLPIFFVRPSGRGNYGNKYSIRLRRDSESEKEYSVKMFRWDLIKNDTISRVTNQFAGSLYQTTRSNVSTLISDVIDLFDTGKCPIYIYPYEDNFIKIYDFYQEIVAENAAYLATADATEDQLEALALAQDIDIAEFDPMFGYVMNTRSDEQIPYYRNYTIKSTGAYITPDMEVPNAARRPANISDWGTAVVGSTVLVLADENNDGLRWRYTVIGIDADTGNISYDEGVENYIDDAEYDGTNIGIAAGIDLNGGHDGDFEEVTIDDVTRAPSDAEMKIFLAREQVRAWRGEFDRKILSPARVDLDFIFDANYNVTYDDGEFYGILNAADAIQAVYGYSSVLTDADYATLSVVTSGPVEFIDINVKKAMYDLNEFRNRNGMTIDKEMGAGCSLYLDCGLVGSKGTTASSELNDIIDVMADYTGRGCSVDFGHYNIFDPYTGRRIDVTAVYFIAEHLIPHIMNYGLNKPFVYGFAQMNAIQRSAAVTAVNTMIRDTFRPDIDLIDWDVKEKLYTNRFNYYLVKDEGRTVQRACQNTRQLDASALLEENNVRVLNTLKKGLEEACRGYLYEWNEPEVRKGYTDSQMAIYRPWIGVMVNDIQIRFDANEWEEDRMIMHCYVDVAFRNIVKRIILEININKPETSTEGGE